MLKNRIIYFLTLAGAVFLIFAYDQPVSYIVLYSILSLTAFSLLFAVISRKFIQLSCHLNKPSAYKNENISFQVRVKNSFFFPYPFLKLFFSEENESLFGLKNTTISLGSFQTLEVPFDISCKFRGEYALGVSKIEIFDFLGIFKFSRTPENEARLTVSPVIKEVFEFSAASSGVVEATGRKIPFWDDYSSVADIRKYQDTDNTKQIHWKASAKKNEIMVKTFENIEGSSVVMLLDLTAVSGDYIKALEREDKMIEYAVSAASAIVMSGVNLHFYFGNESPSFMSCADESSLDILFTTLAAVPFESGPDFNRLLSFCENENAEKGLSSDTNYILLLHTHTHKLIDRLFKLIEKNDVTLFYFPKENDDYEKFAASMREAGITVFVN